MFKKFIITSTILLYISIDQSFALATCQIESSTIPELTQYSQSVDLRLTELRKLASNKSNCGVPIGWVVRDIDKTASIIDRAFLEIPIFDNTFLDFAYNIRLAINGETRAPVTRDGLLFNQIEQKITGALAGATNQCNLSDDIKSGFITLLQENHTLENIFKQAALGSPAIPTWLSPENIRVATAINAGYIPSATESCKDQNGTQDFIATLLKAIENIGAKNEWWLSEWKKAIAIFRGWDDRASIAERSALKERLLREEISRQGFSPHMAEMMLSNFDCVKAKTIEDDNLAATMRAKAECLSNPIMWLENITLLPQRKAVDAAKTTDDRVYKVNQLSDKEKIVKDITNTYARLEVVKTPDLEIKTALMSNLIDIHLGLISTTEQIDKRLKQMYNNCMKAQPGIPCPK